MPVRKFRSVEDVTVPLQPRSFDPANLRVALALSQTCFALHPMRGAPGVHKHRSIEDAATARRSWEDGEP